MGCQSIGNQSTSSYRKCHQLRICLHKRYQKVDGEYNGANGNGSIHESAYELSFEVTFMQDQLATHQPIFSDNYARAQSQYMLNNRISIP